MLPLAGTLTAFYVWTLNSLNLTMKDLKERKQTVKAGMYRKLWYCILISIFTIFGFFFFNSLTFAGVSDPDFVPEHWQSRWFILDGWLNLVYLVDVAFICYVWLPTANNRRFAMSDEVRSFSLLTQQSRVLTRCSSRKTTRALRSPILALKSRVMMKRKAEVAIGHSLARKGHATIPQAGLPRSQM